MATSNSITLAALVLLGALISHTAATTHDDTFYECMPGMPGPGVTLPRGDIEKAVGSEPFELFCLLNPNHEDYKDKGRTSKDLGFFVKGSNDRDWQPLESEILNQTTIKAVYDPKSEATDRIECRINTEDRYPKSVCPQTITVGYPPLKPENFTCISENWESLQCSWDVPYNPVKTTYELYYYEGGHAGRTFRCPSPTPSYQEGKPVNLNSCMLTMRSNPIYRKSWKHYMFYIWANNSIGFDNDSEHYFDVADLDHYAVVRPKSPEKLQVSDIQTRQLDLTFKLDLHLHLFPPGFVSETYYKSEYNPNWTPTERKWLNASFEEFSETLENLYPFTNYDFKVRIKSNATNETNEIWSDFSAYTATTVSDVPQNPPQTTQGSFEQIVHQMQKRNVYVYWRQIPDFQRNGPNHRYIITDVREGGLVKPLVPTKVTAAYALFEDLKHSAYTFFVTSQNENGTAHQTPARLDVPSTDKMRGLQPRAFTKIAYSDQLFEVSWQPPLNDSAVEDYTVFWCRSNNNRDRPYQCEGQLAWEVVPKTKLSLNVSLPDNKVYQFAVSANTQTSSSGMVWATCTILLDRRIGKLKTVNVDVVKKRSMKVSWKLDCSDRIGVVTGYQAVFCKVKSAENHECIGNPSVEETTEDHLTITNLEPFTFYKVQVRVVSKAGESELSDYHINQTARARPGSPPTNLRVENLEANSLKFFWNLPLKPNGPIAEYQIRYGYNHEPTQQYIEDEKITNGEYIRLEGLTYSASYVLKVRACGRVEESRDPLCGDWAAITYETGIGPSDAMPAPLVTFQNSSEVKIQWDKQSFHHGGPIKRYEVRVLAEKTNEEFIINDVNGNASHSLLRLDHLEKNIAPDCDNTNVTYYYDFSIRSVTSNGSDEFYSSWSPVEAVQGYCPASVPWTWIIVGVSFFVFIAFVVMAYFCKAYNWNMETSGLFKEVGNQVQLGNKVSVPIKPTVNPLHQHNGVIHNGIPYSTSDHSKVDWTEMQDMPSPQSGKKNYERSCSQETMENLITKRKALEERGTSESTSGCDSGQNYESDEMDGNSDKSRNPSSVSTTEIIPTGDTNRVAPMPYTQIGPNGWPQFRQTSDAEQVITSEGYTRATQLFPDSNSLENLRPPSNLPTSEHYIQFQSFGRSSPSSQDSHSLTITPVATSPINKPPVVASAGYISVDEANKINQERSSELSDINPRAYSRVANIPSSSQSNSSMISNSSSPAALNAKDLTHPTADLRPNGSSKHTYV